MMSSVSDFAEWLRLVDPSGGLDGYLPALEERCSIAEFGPRYVHRGRAGIEGFFDDVGVVDVSHQKLFSKYFDSVAGPGASAEVKGEGKVSAGMSFGLMGSAHQAAVDVSAAAAAIKEANAAAAAVAPSSPLIDDGLRDMEGWLRSVDPSGSLDRYLPVLEEFLDLDDVRALRAVLLPLLPPDRKQNGPVPDAVAALLGSRFFGAVGISDEDDQRLFGENYFLLAPGAAATARPASAAPGGSSIGGEASAVLAAPALEEALASAALAPSSPTAGSSSLADWLLAADPSGGLQGFLPVLEEQLSDVAELEKLYVVTSGSPPRRTLDERFFESMGIDKVGDEGHRRLLSSYVEKSG